MRSYRVEGQDVRELIGALAPVFASEVWKTWSAGENRFHLMVGKKLFLRTNSEASLTVVAHEETRDVVNLFVLGTGGGTGLFGITWGANEAYEAEFERSLLDAAQRRGLRVERVPPELRSRVQPQTTHSRESVESPREVRCPNCGMRGPADKGECYYCRERLRL